MTEPRCGGVDCVCVCVCVFLHVFICVGLIFLDPVFHEWVWRTVFTRQLPPRRCCFSFWKFILCLEHRAAVFSTVKIDFFLMKCGGEGCFEEVFDGRAWREELGIHLPCHTSPSQDKQVGYVNATVFNQFWQPSRCSLLHTLVWWQLSWLCILLRILFLSRVTATFSQPPSSQTRLIRSLFTTEESVQSTSHLAFLSFFKFFQL